MCVCACVRACVHACVCVFYWVRVLRFKKVSSKRMFAVYIAYCELWREKREDIVIGFWLVSWIWGRSTFHSNMQLPSTKSFNKSFIIRSFENWDPLIINHLLIISFIIPRQSVIWIPNITHKYHLYFIKHTVSDNPTKIVNLPKA